MKVIPLTRDKFAIVDDEDFERLMEHSWAWVPACNSAIGQGYAVRKGSKRRGEPRTVQMHREILGVAQDVNVDHINCNGLDNRKRNLRLATTQQNAFNRAKPTVPCTSRYKGVLMRKNDNRWSARIKFNDRHVELGKYLTEENAAAAYNFASRIFFGRYRRENENVEELSFADKKRIFETAERYINRYGWYVDTETYRSFKLEVAQ